MRQSRFHAPHPVGRRAGREFRSSSAEGHLPSRNNPWTGAIPPVQWRLQTHTGTHHNWGVQRWDRLSPGVRPVRPWPDGTRIRKTLSRKRIRARQCESQAGENMNRSAASSSHANSGMTRGPLIGTGLRRGTPFPKCCRGGSIPCRAATVPASTTAPEKTDVAAYSPLDGVERHPLTYVAHYDGDAP